MIAVVCGRFSTEYVLINFFYDFLLHLSSGMDIAQSRAGVLDLADWGGRLCWMG